MRLSGARHVLPSGAEVRHRGTKHKISAFRELVLEQRGLAVNRLNGPITRHVRRH